MLKGNNQCVVALDSPVGGNTGGLLSRLGERAAERNAMPAAS